MSYLDNSSTDVSLLVHLASGKNEEAWQTFLDRYIKLILGWCQYWNVQPADTDEVVQETVLAVVKGFKDFQRQGEGSFRAWLKTVARNCWKRVVSCRVRATGKCDLNWEQFSADNAAENHLMQLFEEWATRELLELACDRACRRVDEQTWQMYKLTAFEHLSSEEVANRLNVSVRQVYDGVFRVRRMIREELTYLDP